jgi:hypothetical protein
MLMSSLCKWYEIDLIFKNDVVRGCSTYGAKRNSYNILVGKAEGKRPLERPRHRWRIILKWTLEK